jgi:hypothetical protein
VEYFAAHSPTKTMANVYKENDIVTDHEASIRSSSQELLFQVVSSGRRPRLVEGVT